MQQRLAFMMIHRWFGALSTCVGRTIVMVGCFVGAQLSGAAVAQTQQSSRENGISLTPGVVELKGRTGQAHRQTLSLTNHTQLELAFELVAQDVVVENGRRTFLPAGQRPDSIAATALFSPERMVIPPGTTGSAEITITVPDGTAVRAVAAIFRGLTQVEVQSGVAMTGSLGTLMTFALTEDVRLEGSEIAVSAQTDTTNLSLSQQLRNVGAEPLVSGGAIALVDAAGRLITRLPIEAHRLLPGEQVNIVGDYPGSLSAGRYQAVLSLGYGPHLLTRSISFYVSPADSPDAATPRRTGNQ